MNLLTRLRPSQDDPRVPEGSPSVEIDVDGAVPVRSIWLVMLAAGLAITGLCWWGGAPTPGVVLTGVLLALLLAWPRTIMPALWLAVVGSLLLVSDGVTGWARPLWVIALVASVHACLVGTRLVQNLGRWGQVSREALVIRLRTQWRPQAVAQALGVLAWWPLGVQQPWVTALALLGVVALLLLLTTRRWGGR